MWLQLLLLRRQIVLHLLLCSSASLVLATGPGNVRWRVDRWPWRADIVPVERLCHIYSWIQQILIIYLKLRRQTHHALRVDINGPIFKRYSIFITCVVL